VRADGGGSVILWCDGAHDAAENMRRDTALLAGAESGAPPVMRLFRFEPPGITLGRSQDPAQELDLARCEADGVRWAVRPTGGRAIFHAEEWTWCIAAPRDDPEWGGSPEAAYRSATLLVVRALVRLGVPAEMVPRRSRGPGTPRVRGAPARPRPATR